MATLSKAQKEDFWRDGYLVVEDVVDAALLRTMQNDFSGWAEESRGHSEPSGEMINGRPRFDLEPGHRADKPGLRRVNAPVEVSGADFQAMTSV
jgi:phytanoyl-CoA hydroxylase